MLKNLRTRAKDEQGFTLIELLVVILIIGILAAIAIPNFIGQRTKADDAAAKAVVRTAQTALETYFTDNQTYVGATPAELRKIEPTLPTTVTTPVLTQTGYTVTAVSNRSNAVTYTLVRAANGGVTRTCDYPANLNAGGCRTVGATKVW